MKIKLDDRAEELMAQITEMPADKQEAFKTIVIAILEVMASENGCAVLALDTEGNGRVLMSILGNAMIAPHLTRAMADVMDQMDETVGGMQ